MATITTIDSTDKVGDSRAVINTNLANLNTYKQEIDAAGNAVIVTAEMGDKDGGNYTEVEADGTTQAKGDATCWDDVVISLIGRRLYTNQGTVDYNYSENAIVFSDGGDIDDDNDCVIWNLQLPHAAKIDSSCYPHIHFEQTSSDNVEFTVRYRIQDNGATKTTAWTTLTADVANDSVFEYTSGTLNQIMQLAAINLTGCAISSTIQFRMTRTDSEGGTVNVTFTDTHFEFDMLGSRQQYVK